GARGAWKGRHGSDAAPPRQELGRGRRPDRTRGSILVRERPVRERFPERDAGTRGPVTPAFPARAGRTEPGVPDVPASLAPERGERGRGDPEGTRTKPGPGGDDGTPAAAASPLPPGGVLVRARRGSQGIERARPRDPAERPRDAREGRRDGVPRPARGRRDDPTGIRTAPER